MATHTLCIAQVTEKGVRMRRGPLTPCGGDTDRLALKLVASVAAVGAEVLAEVFLVEGEGGVGGPDEA